MESFIRFIKHGLIRLESLRSALLTDFKHFEWENAHVISLSIRITWRVCASIDTSSKTKRASVPSCLVTDERYVRLSVRKLEIVFSHSLDSGTPLRNVVFFQVYPCTKAEISLATISQQQSHIVPVEVLSPDLLNNMLTSHSRPPDTYPADVGRRSTTPIKYTTP